MSSDGFTFVVEQVQDLGWRATNIGSPEHEVVAHSIDELRAAIEQASLEYVAEHGGGRAFVAAYVWEDKVGDSASQAPTSRPMSRKTPTFEVTGAPGNFIATSVDTPIRLASETLAGIMERGRAALPSSRKVGYFERLTFDAASTMLGAEEGLAPKSSARDLAPLLRSRVIIWAISALVFVLLWWLTTPTTDLLATYRAGFALLVTIVPAFAPLALMRFRLPPVGAWERLALLQKLAFSLVAIAWALLWSGVSISLLATWLPI